MKNDKFPKKHFLSMQLDLSKFEPATESEKEQQQQMGKSTTFFRDGMKSLFKNPLAVGSIIVLFFIILVIIVAPFICPYGYEEIIEINGVKDTTTKNLHPFQYSDAERLFMKKDAVFMGWSTKRVYLLDNQAYVDSLVEQEGTLVTNSFELTKNTTLYAVWGVDEDKNGVVDF